MQILEIIFGILLYSFVIYMILSKYLGPGKSRLLKDEIKKIFKETAYTLSLQSESTLFFWTSNLSGSVRDFSIEIKLRLIKWDKRVLIILKYDLPGSKEWSIVTENKMSALQKTVGVEDIRVGDGIFDQTFFLRAGKESDILSYLNTKVREIMTDLQSSVQTLEIHHNRVEVSIAFENIGNRDVLLSCIYKMVELAASFTEEPDIKKRLINNAVFDYITKFRMYNLEQLTASFLDDKDTVSTLNKVLQDKSQNIQIFAATFLKEEGLRFMLDLIKARQVTSKNILEILNHLEQSRYLKSIPVLLDYYPDATVPEKIAIVHALGVFEDQSCENFLLDSLDWLKKDQYFIEQQLSIIEALGRCGTIKSIEHLFKLQHTFSYPYLNNTLQKAIALIQERAGVEGEKGWLSLSDLSETEGGLSLPQENEGGLSITELE